MDLVHIVSDSDNTEKLSHSMDLVHIVSDSDNTEKLTVGWAQNPKRNFWSLNVRIIFKFCNHEKKLVLLQVTSNSILNFVTNS